MSYRIGVDLGGTGIKAGVLDEGNRLLSRIAVPTCAARPFEEVAADLAGAAVSAAREAGLSMEDFPCVGFCTPGRLDPATGRLVFSGNLGWKDVPIRETLQRLLPAPVFVDNDASCAVAGEVIAGAARGLKNVVMLTLGTGVGGGLILDGRLFCGGDGMGAELGHTILALDGEPCTCGARGCVEAYASVTALIRQTRAAMDLYPDSLMHAHAARLGKVSGHTAFDCARQGDGPALAVVDRYADYLAAAVGSMITVFRPQAVLIGGGLSNEGGYLLDRVGSRLPRYVFAAGSVSLPPVLRAGLGNDAGLIGAAYLDTM